MLCYRLRHTKTKQATNNTMNVRIHGPKSIDKIFALNKQFQAVADGFNDDCAAGVVPINYC